jgi:SAM-dependent methyltransferase
VHERSHDLWASGAAYERYVGRWSRPVARAFLAWLAVPASAQWLDVGSGTGALVEEILNGAAPERVIGVDRSAAYVAYARERVQDARAAFVVGDATALPLARASLDAAVSALAINFVTDPRAAVAEMAGAVRPGGCVAAYVWDYAGKMELIRTFWDAAVSLDPRAAALDEGRCFPLCQPAALASLFGEVGLRDVESRAIDVPTPFRDFDDYWGPFLGGQGPAPAYVASLGAGERARLREHLRRALPVAADGTIRLVARAWAVRGDVE